MSLKRYPCTQRELFAVCLTGWKNCLQNISRFNAFRPLYTEAYVDSRLKEIARVDELPGRSKRSAQQDLARIALKKKLEECQLTWKKLKLAIPTIFPGSEQDAHYKDMGQEYYEASKHFKWEACTGLMNAALSFSQQHAALLESSPLLGPGIVTEIKTLTDALQAALGKYLDKRQEFGKGADHKTNACNELHKDLTLMLTDAKMIFKNDPSILKDFHFDTILDFVSGHGSAGIKGNISNGRVPIHQIPDLLLTLTENGDEAYIADDGSYRFSQLAAGVYTIHLTAKGYQELTLSGVTVNPGSYTTQHIKLVPEGDSKR
jgi:hypothetical protein